MSLRTSATIGSPNFPEGQLVKLYPDSNWPTPGLRSGEPVGPVLDEGTVDEGTVTFTELGPNSLYWAVAEVDGEFIYLSIYQGKVPPEDARVLYGEGEPENEDGDSGDLYIDIIAWAIWGPKDPDPEVTERWGEAIPWGLKAENDLNVHEEDHTGVHGIADTSLLALKSELGGGDGLVIAAGAVEPGGNLAAGWGAEVETSKVAGEGEEEGPDGAYQVTLIESLPGPAVIILTSGQSKRHVFSKGLMSSEQWEVNAEDFSGVAKDASFNFVIIGG